MNVKSKQGSTSANADDGYIRDQPLSQNSFCEDITESESLNQTPQASSIRGGVAGVEPPAKSQNNFTSNSETWSASVQTLLDQPPSTLPRKLIMGGMLFCLAFGAWATFGKIEEVGHAQGKLVPQGEVYKIHPVELGKVANIAVKEGQTVKAGQLLVELETGLDKIEAERLQQMMTANRNQLSQMQAMIGKIRLEAKARAAMAEADAQAQKAAIAQAENKASATDEQLTQLQADIAASKQRLARLEPQAGKAQELLTQRQTDVDAAQERLARLKPLVKDGAIAKEHLFEAEQTLRDRTRAITQSQLEEATTIKERLFDAEQTLRDRTRAITQNQGELKQALAQVDQLQAGLLEKQAEAEKAQIEASQRIGQLEVEVAQLEAKNAEIKNMLDSTKAKLVQKFLYAPVNGSISSLNLQNTGEVVQPGQTIAEIAPRSAPLVLSASLPNREAGFVKTGMPVQVKFDAYPYQDYGVIPGKVKSISPDAKQDQRLGAVYQVEVELERNYVTAKQQNVEFKAGQTATADIIIRRRRIIDIVLDPIRQLQTGGIGL